MILIEPFGDQFARISLWLVTRRKFQAACNVVTSLQERTIAGCIYPEDMTLRMRLLKAVSVLDGDLRFPGTRISIYQGLGGRKYTQLLPIHIAKRDDAFEAAPQFARICPFGQ